MIADGLGEDERGVSAVIGVVLMVGITVVLAATVGTFVLDVGDSLNDPTPTAFFAADQDKEKYTDGSNTAKFTEVEVVYRGGDQIDPDRIQVRIDRSQAYARGDEATYSGDDVYQVAKPFGDKDMITAGTTARIWTKTDTYDTDYWTKDRSSNDDPYFSATGSGDVAMETHNSDSNPSPVTELDIETGEIVRIIYETRQGNKNILFQYEVK